MRRDKDKVKLAVTELLFVDHHSTIPMSFMFLSILSYLIVSVEIAPALM